ncbi:hypothetical protein [Clostridium cibarium]|uniref:hypothetical protein n=1 Tax=Clostridium cibarium TaxID=2762247 RepID=UPI001FAC6524|nr:hypothetical protein [Clostridium cibarium]
MQLERYPLTSSTYSPFSLHYFERSLSDKVYVYITIKNFSVDDIFFLDFAVFLLENMVALVLQVANVDLLIPVSNDNFDGDIFSGGSILAIKLSFSSFVYLLFLLLSLLIVSLTRIALITLYDNYLTTQGRRLSRTVL